MKSTNQLLPTWELIEETNKLDDSNEMKPIILKALGVSQKLNSLKGGQRLPITALVHRSNSQLMLEQIDNKKMREQFKNIYNVEHQ